MPLADDDAILSLHPVSYRWKTDGSRHFGFTAQDVENVYPRLVSSSADGTKQLASTELIAPLVREIQQLSKRIKTLEEKVKAQK